MGRASLYSAFLVSLACNLAVTLRVEGPPEADASTDQNDSLETLREGADPDCPQDEGVSELLKHLTATVASNLSANPDVILTDNTGTALSQALNCQKAGSGIFECQGSYDFFAAAATCFMVASKISALTLIGLPAADPLEALSWVAQLWAKDSGGLLSSPHALVLDSVQVILHELKSFYFEKELMSVRASANVLADSIEEVRVTSALTDNCAGPEVIGWLESERSAGQNMELLISDAMLAMSHAPNIKTQGASNFRKYVNLVDRLLNVWISMGMGRMDLLLAIIDKSQACPSLIDTAKVRLQQTLLKNAVKRYNDLMTTWTEHRQHLVDQMVKAEMAEIKKMSSSRFYMTPKPMYGREPKKIREVMPKLLQVAEVSDEGKELVYELMADKDPDVILEVVKSLAIAPELQRVQFDFYLAHSIFMLGDRPGSSKNIQIIRLRRLIVEILLGETRGLPVGGTQLVVDISVFQCDYEEALSDVGPKEISTEIGIEWDETCDRLRELQRHLRLRARQSCKRYHV